MANNPTIYFSPVIKDKIPGLQLGLLFASDVNINKKSDIVEQSFIDLEKFICTKFSNNPPSSDSIVSAVRRMYRRIGWEPTQYRPSSEAMIRRFLKSKGLYRINNFVDLGNETSTRFHLPMGLYDSDKISGNIFIDIGKENETYQGISKDLIHAEGKLILRDEVGIFGNPTADSKRSSLQADTKNVIAIFFTPPEVGENILIQTLDHLRNLYHHESPNATFHQEILTNQ